MSSYTKNKIEPVSDALHFSSPLVGSVLTILAGLSFLVLAMLLPLVGKAGAVTDHYTQNLIAFSSVLVVTLALSVAATMSKLQRRREDGSPFPYFSAIVLGFTLLFGVSLMLGLLKI
ncbi:MAG TPA: hypothetical protein PKE55_06045 [Kiritimatiellia bacterium]|nr:hypothetical protein [Kiritimatiellia bacterium]